MRFILSCFLFGLVASVQAAEKDYSVYRDSHLQLPAVQVGNVFYRVILGHANGVFTVQEVGPSEAPAAHNKAQYELVSGDLFVPAVYVADATAAPVYQARLQRLADTETLSFRLLESKLLSAGGIRPSFGAGGTIHPGTSASTEQGALIQLPANYAPHLHASPVIWLFNETWQDWHAIAEEDRVILVDLREYNDTGRILTKLSETMDLLYRAYNVDHARFYWAGWSAGGSIAVMLGALNQDIIAGVMVFPGSGGSIALDAMRTWQGHKMRLFYACGTADPYFPAAAVEYESAFWLNYGYQSHFQAVAEAGHYLDENRYGIRAGAWAWMKNFNLLN